MPSTIKVKVKSVELSERGNKNGFEIVGFDATNKKGYKTFIFETTQSGDATKAGLVARDLQSGDWIECVVDDSKWKNIQTMKKTSAGTGGGSSSRGTGIMPSSGGGSKKKGEFRTVPMLNREVALTQAVKFSEGKKVSADKLIDLAGKMENYLVNGLRTPGDEAPVNEPTPPVEEPTVTPDDDIPF